MSEFHDDDIEDIEPVIDAEGEFLRAMQSLDPDLIMESWSESDMASLVFPGIDMAKGSMEIRMAWADITENTSHLDTDLRPASYMRSGDLAWTFLTGQMISTHGDETLSIEVYITNVWHREAGGWKLMHMNCSPGPHQPVWFEQRLN